MGTSLLALTEKSRTLVESGEIQLGFHWNGDITVMVLNDEMDDIIKKTKSRAPYIRWIDFNNDVNKLICKMGGLT
jgi:hypothetical protein